MFIGATFYWNYQIIMLRVSCTCVCVCVCMSVSANVGALCMCSYVLCVGVCSCVCLACARGETTTRAVLEFLLEVKAFSVLSRDLDFIAYLVHQKYVAGNRFSISRK